MMGVVSSTRMDTGRCFGGFLNAKQVDANDVSQPQTIAT